ncbi:MAG: ribosomal protein S18-alanine N-acetyltransferase [Halanaerobiales bacterium]|nr:ribosomal protein S18-alanine N-acetyltransferase [Halanaerobiales bacterium]
MEIRIAPMKEADLSQVMAIEQKSFADPWTLQSFYREIQENPYSRYLVAYRQERLVAYIGGWLITDQLHITNLAVDPQERGNGLAKKLLDELVRLSRKEGINKATLEVRVSNDAAINLYRKNGFAIVGRRPKYYINNQEDALIMWKEYQDAGG